MNLFRKKPLIPHNSTNNYIILPAPKRHFEGSNFNYSNKRKTLPIEVIVRYLKTVQDAINLKMVSKNCLTSFSYVKKNPFYSGPFDSLIQKEEIINKEISLFPNIETLRCDIETIKILDLNLLKKLSTIELVGKLIYAPLNIIHKIQQRICEFGFYIDENLTFDLESMNFLQRLHVDINNNSEMIYFSKFMNNIIQTIQHLPYFKKLFIECNGDDLLRLQEVLQKFHSTRINCVLLIHNLKETHLTNVLELLNKKNITLGVFENELTSSLSYYDFKLLFLDHYTLSLPDSLLFSNQLQKISLSHFLPHLDIFGYKIEVTPIHSLIDLKNIVCLQEFRLVNSMFSKPISLLFPTSLTRLEITTSFNFSLPNLLEIPLKEFCVSSCNSIKEFYIPPSAKLVEVSHCDSVCSFPNLHEVPLESLLCIECNKVSTLTIGTTLKSLSLYWCSNISSLNLKSGLEQLDIFYNKKLKNIDLPITLTSFHINFCEQLTKLNHFEALEPIAPIELKYKFKNKK
ncbi:hypothetical protein EDI_208080 [Entamoeba dispar SAW760]|uniref:Leucine-rich repeat containing protein n=1 Tax=Entamoeba dispar (strain ATCC PRA-260 / SAW760) TaxID=370354 RepID=B0EPF3_ENTDS|nr:uncharacterized protein EDI_208080 [Entamoeba dispar SAW760]EDR23592.1 hypothetical protein EDI_208080 [Entamoeba dispar SAW760]|eukprot:EDR23592.1 hypothetical protein EDI_208080 [Entamoeba dispar SAW760]